MKKLTSSVAALLLAIFLPPAGIALAGDANVIADGIIEFGEDANQGSGTQTNADDWEDMANAVAGSGSQASDIGGAANTGSGTQDNTDSSQDYWFDIDNVNTDSGAQILDSDNSNGGDRISDDVILDLGYAPELATSDLEAAVSGNSVAVAGDGGSASSAMQMSGDSDFSGLAGVNAVALGAGSNASQSVSVNVTASVSAN